VTRQRLATRQNSVDLKFFMEFPQRHSVYTQKGL
jgi:hypothetical protein